MTDVPVLFLVFNRPDLVERTFQAIRSAKPGRLFVASDGPRPGRIEDRKNCEQSRAIVEKIDWDCEVKTLFRETNLGCRVAVSTAIAWFFSQVEEGIILEDDCLPNNSFFRFCSQLLERYREDERVMCITGNNFQNGHRRGSADYYFSIYNHIWGWATWRRAWDLYDPNASSFKELDRDFLFEGFLRENVAEYWRNLFRSIDKPGFNTWDYQWTFACWANSGLTITPNVNLVSNIGFDERATHTKDTNSSSSCLPCHAIDFPLKHPKHIVRDVVADRFVEAFHFGLSANNHVSQVTRLRRRLAKFIRR